MAELAYKKAGAYLIPDLMMDGEDEMEEMPLGKYGMLRDTFLRENHRTTYMSWMLQGTLQAHLWEIDQRAQEEVDQMVAEMMKRDGVNEELKANDPMVWVQKVNALTAQAEEVVLKEIVYK